MAMLNNQMVLLNCYFGGIPHVQTHPNHYIKLLLYPIMVVFINAPISAYRMGFIPRSTCSFFIELVEGNSYRKPRSLFDYIWWWKQVKPWFPVVSPLKQSIDAHFIRTFDRTWIFSASRVVKVFCARWAARRLICWVQEGQFPHCYDCTSYIILLHIQQHFPRKLGWLPIFFFDVKWLRRIRIWNEIDDIMI